MKGNMGSITIDGVIAKDVSYQSENGRVPQLDLSHDIGAGGDHQLDHDEVLRLRNWLNDWLGHHRTSADRIDATTKLVNEKHDAKALADYAKEVDKVYGANS